MGRKLEMECEKCRMRHGKLKMKGKSEKLNEIKMGNRGSGKWPMVNGKYAMASDER